MQTFDRTRTLPMPRRKTVVIPTRRSRGAETKPTTGTTAAWLAAASAERLEADRAALDMADRKHASVGSGTALAPMPIKALNRVSRSVTQSEKVVQISQEAQAASEANADGVKISPIPTYGVTLALLRGRFPAIFEAARPLKIGIHKDLREALGQEVSMKDLRAFLGVWTHRKAYRQALAAGVRRIDLHGNDAGPAEPALEPNYQKA